MADPYETLGLVRNPDGTITRNPSFVFPTTEATTLDTSSPVLSKDIQINHSKNTWARIFLPNLSPPPSAAATKLPLIIYHHGGGFVFKITPSTTPIHNFCLNIAAAIPAVVVSVDYRTAPEHRLPAAYDDAMEALIWIRSRSSEDEWLKKHADFSNCFLMGTSAGANTVYHAGHRAAEMVDELDRLRIRGLILNQPFFGGVQRTGSELRLVDDPVVPLRLCDVMWDLCLPIGADRDHEYCNPTVEGRLNGFERIKALGWKVLVNGCDGDPFFDRQVEAAKLMEESGVNVMMNFVSGGSHGVEKFDIVWAERLFSIIKVFMSSTEV